MPRSLRLFKEENYDGTFHIDSRGRSDFSLMLRTWLGKKGFQVETAGNVASARKLLSNRSFDLILSDLRLPDGDGLSLLSWKTNMECRRQ